MSSPAPVRAGARSKHNSHLPGETKMTPACPQGHSPPCCALFVIPMHCAAFWNSGSSLKAIGIIYLKKKFSRAPENFTVSVLN